MSRDKKRSQKKKSGGHANSGGRELSRRVDEVFARAIEYHRSGNLEQAKSLYRQILHHDAKHAAAVHLLGFAEFQTRNYSAAIEAISAAVGFEPDNAEFHNNLALAFLAAKRWEDAQRHAQRAAELGHTDGHGHGYGNVALEFLERREYEWAEKAIRLGFVIQTPSAEAHHYLGLIYAAQQRFAEAEACFRQALEMTPRYVEALNNLGNVLRDQHRIEEAVPIYRRALEIAPTFAAAYNNLGVALVNDGRIEQGIDCYERALRLQPEFAEALNNLGNAYRDLGNLETALEYYRKALRIQPHSPEIQSNLAVALRRLGKLSEAVAYFRRAIVLQPRGIKIHSHLASAFVEQEQLDDAIRCIQHIERLEPEQPLWKLRAASLCPTIFTSREESDSYLTSLTTQFRAVAQSDFPLEFVNFTDIAPPAPFNLQFQSECIRGIKTEYASLFTKKLDAAYRAQWIDGWRGPASRPRLGFVVTEDHEGIFLKSLSGILARLSVRDFEIAVFCSYRGQSRVRTAIARDDVQTVALPTRVDHIARTIDESRCDLLYYWETGTDAFSYFMPFLRLAPIQLTSWGIQVTSGIPNVDYYVSNQFVEPEDAAEHYSEQLVLAKTFLTFRPRTQIPHAACARDSFGIPGDRHWYVCAQQLGKFHIDFDAMIADVLRRDEHGIVVLTGDPISQQVQRLQQRLRINCSDVFDRIHFVPRLDTSKYLGLLRRAHVLLDPPHFGGVNSTYDGLSLGKAIVVMPSRFHRGRYTFGCYRKMGLLECVAENVEDYARIAVEIATNDDYRHHLERSIAEASSVLFEDYQAVLEHERVFHELLAMKH